ncbi:hypothetical protein HHI36_020460 [Cryptolaemus montrouzieri]|uniref:Uncharacterized protein n=1 Tax=Cryptolaemus montrouzieri TaxID=559131 RepID=A0ABD2NBZ7_9CUCU
MHKMNTFGNSLKDILLKQAAGDHVRIPHQDIGLNLDKYSEKNTKKQNENGETKKLDNDETRQDKLIEVCKNLLLEKDSLLNQIKELIEVNEELKRTSEHEKLIAKAHIERLENELNKTRYNLNVTESLSDAMKEKSIKYKNKLRIAISLINDMNMKK